MTDLLPVEGPGAPPRTNGELVFDAPWQPRLFGLTVSLHEAGRFEWGEFQQRLIDAIGAWEATASPGDAYRYWDHWQTAFETLVADLAFLPDGAVSARADAYAARPHGHDHDHSDHHHHHDH